MNGFDTLLFLYLACGLGLLGIIKYLGIYEFFGKGIISFLSELIFMIIIIAFWWVFAGAFLFGLIKGLCHGKK